MEATATTGETTPSEAELKTEIRVLERKISNKAEHVERLSRELEDLKVEQRRLKQQRIDLLAKELE
jgi:predicted RNase H-like nuclease (RuvC/YqgF family)